MDQVLEKSFDFSIRIIELVKYLNEEKKPFPLSERLLACVAEMGVCLRLAELTGEKSAGVRQALSCAVEAEYLLEAMVKTGYLTEKQSRPVIGGCRALKSLIAGLLQKKDARKKSPAPGTRKS